VKVQNPVRNVYLGLPAYNEELAVDPLFKRIRAARASLMTTGLASELFVIVYDDGSTDNTANEVREHAEGLEVLLLSPKSNGGLGVALRGLINEFLDQADTDDVLVIMDADDTHDPRQIVELLSAIDGKAKDVVIASRYRKRARILGVPKYRQILSLGFGVLMRLVLPIQGVRDYSCGYRAYTYESLSKLTTDQGFPIQESGFASMPEVLIRLRSHQLNFGEIPLVLSYDRRLTVSKMQAWHNSWRLINRIFDWRLFPSHLQSKPTNVPDQRVWWEVETL